MRNSRHPREARTLAIVATNFTFVLGYLSFVAVLPWNLKAVVVFSIAVVATLYCWCMTLI